ncbi:MAG: hypothetical protein JWQ62_1358, partial [Lacunisphaera sp.]|nr:hypothetical protein [Lacunisphaera sp.]
MKSRASSFALTMLLAFTASLPLHAQSAPTPAAESSEPAEFKPLIEQIKAKLKAGQRT